MMRFSFIVLTLLLLTACSTSSNDKDARVIAEKVSNILDQMTLAEKVGQMTQVDLRMFDDINDIKTYYIGSVLSGGSGAPKNNTPKDWLDMVNGFQKIAMGNRLSIPLIYGVDAVHGHNNLLGATVFPHNIALGASNDSDLVFRVNKATATEVAATGIHWTFSPCVAVPQDPRWGRFYEGFGQTTALVNGLTTAAVNGYQALLTGTNDKQVAACAKHFVGDGGTVWGTGTEVDGIHAYLIDQGDVQLDDEALRELHLPPYERAIAADVKTIMVSFSSLRGEKCHGSNFLINDLLKEELGFKGFVVSDWGGINQIPGDYKSDVINGINAGIDMVMVPGIRKGDPSYAKNKHYKTFIQYLIEAVNEGSVSMDRIDDAVSRILKVKMEIGLFDNPFIDDAYLGQIGSPEHRALAREAVQKSTILLKNKGSLPMTKNATLTVVGSAANNLGVQNGGWTTDWQGIFTPDFAFLDYNADSKLTIEEYYSQLRKVYESKFEKNSWTGHFEEIDLDNDGIVTPADFSGFMENRVLQPNGTTILEGLSQVAPDAEIVYSPNAATIAEGSIVLAVVGEYPYAEGFGDDGDLDLFIGGRLTPKKYPYPASSRILENQSTDTEIKFVDVTDQKLIKLKNIGLVTTSNWLDFDGDGWDDLIVAGEWMPIRVFKNNSGKSFVEITDQVFENEQYGWWYDIEKGDFDNDGDIDLIAGNLGLNYKYKASEEKPFRVYLNDFDKNSKFDIVLSYNSDGTEYPVRGRQCSSEQIPAIKDKFKDYNSFASASLEQIYSTKMLDESLKYEITSFSSVYLENLGGKFEVRPLPYRAQFSNINAVVVKDVDDDGNLDAILAGNLYNSEVETPRNDASYGLWLKGDGKGGFSAQAPRESGLVLHGDVRNIRPIEVGQNTHLLVAINNQALTEIKIN